MFINKLIVEINKKLTEESALESYLLNEPTLDLNGVVKIFNGVENRSVRLSCIEWVTQIETFYADMSFDDRDVLGIVSLQKLTLIRDSMLKDFNNNGTKDEACNEVLITKRFSYQMD